MKILFTFTRWSYTIQPLEKTREGVVGPSVRINLSGGDGRSCRRLARASPKAIRLLVLGSTAAGNAKFTVCGGHKACVTSFHVRR